MRNGQSNINLGLSGSPLLLLQGNWPSISGLSWLLCSWQQEKISSIINVIELPGRRPVPLGMSTRSATVWILAKTITMEANSTHWVARVLGHAFSHLPSYDAVADAWWFRTTITLLLVPCVSYVNVKSSSISPSRSGNYSPSRCDRRRSSKWLVTRSKGTITLNSQFRILKCPSLSVWEREKVSEHYVRNKYVNSVRNASGLFSVHRNMARFVNIFLNMSCMILFNVKPTLMEPEHATPFNRGLKYWM